MKGVLRCDELLEFSDARICRLVAASGQRVLWQAIFARSFVWSLRHIPVRYSLRIAVVVWGLDGRCCQGESRGERGRSTPVVQVQLTTPTRNKRADKEPRSVAALFSRSRRHSPLSYCLRIAFALAPRRFHLGVYLLRFLQPQPPSGSGTAFSGAVVAPTDSKAVVEKRAPRPVPASVAGQGVGSVPQEKKSELENDVPRPHER